MVNDPMTIDNTIFFCSADNKYALYAATSLLSIRRYCQKCNLAIIGAQFSDAIKKILHENAIQCIELPLHGYFTKGWTQYPRECYYLFVGPEHFYQQGFQYSVYIDGDILCLNDPIKGVGEITEVAGIKSSSYGHVLGYLGENAMERFHEIWKFDRSMDAAKRLSSGVIYYNNAAMKDYSLLRSAQNIYQKCLENNLMCWGDDSLFALTQLLVFDQNSLRDLGPNYNFMPCYFGFDAKREDLVFFHFDNYPKPWHPNPFSHPKIPQYDIYNPYVKEWLDIYQKIKSTQ